MEDFQDLLKSAADIWSKNENEKVLDRDRNLTSNKNFLFWSGKKGFLSFI